MFGFENSSSLITLASLLEHLVDEHPHAVLQAPPAARHWHLFVLHEELLEHVQQIPDLLFCFTSTIPSPEQSNLEFPESSSNWPEPARLPFLEIRFLTRLFEHSHSSSVESLSECSDSDVSMSSKNNMELRCP